MPVPSISLEGRTAIVTGGGRGIGRGAVAALLDLGARVAVVDRDTSTLQACVEELSELGELVAVVGDVRSAADAEAAVRTTLARFDDIDILVNNAGGTFGASFTEVSEKGEATLIAENFTQVTRMIRLCVPHMRPNVGSIISVTSVDAHQGAPRVAHYAAMKAAIESLTKSLALELAPLGIRVNAIAPDGIVTPGTQTVFGEVRGPSDLPAFIPVHMPPIGRMGLAEDCGAAIAFLASDMARFITGSSLAVDGGLQAGGNWHLVGSCLDPSTGTVPLMGVRPDDPDRP